VITSNPVIAAIAVEVVVPTVTLGSARVQLVVNATAEMKLTVEPLVNSRVVPSSTDERGSFKAFPSLPNKIKYLTALSPSPLSTANVNLVVESPLFS
jgi:hypothetical protein